MEPASQRFRVHHSSLFMLAGLFYLPPILLSVMNAALWSQLPFAMAAGASALIALVMTYVSHFWSYIEVEASGVFVKTPSGERYIRYSQLSYLRPTTVRQSPRTTGEAVVFHLVGGEELLLETSEREELTRAITRGQRAWEDAKDRRGARDKEPPAAGYRIAPSATAPDAAQDEADEVDEQRSRGGER